MADPARANRPQNRDGPPLPGGKRCRRLPANRAACVADLRDYVRHWPVALGFGAWLLIQAAKVIALGACVYVGVLGIGALLGAVW